MITESDLELTARLLRNAVMKPICSCLNPIAMESLSPKARDLEWIAGQDELWNGEGSFQKRQYKSGGIASRFVPRGRNDGMLLIM